MIHFISEGQAGKSGLNIYWYRWWIAFRWLSVDLDTNLVKEVYLRFRFLPKHPAIFLSTASWNIIKQYCWMTDRHMITREIHEDLINQVTWYKEFYEKGSAPSCATPLNGFYD